MKKNYLITNPDEMDERAFPVKWSIIPGDRIDEIPGWYFEKRKQVLEDGNIREVSIIYLTQTDPHTGRFVKIKETEDYVLYIQ